MIPPLPSAAAHISDPHRGRPPPRRSRPRPPPRLLPPAFPAACPAPPPPRPLRYPPDPCSSGLAPGGLGAAPPRRPPTPQRRPRSLARRVRRRDLEPRDPARRVGGLEASADFDPVHVRQVDAPPRHRRLMPPGDGEGVAAVDRLQNGESRRFQRPPPC